MKRDKVNFIVGLISLIVLLALMTSGAIIAWPHENGPNETNPLGVSRHDWGNIHLWLGATFIVLMLVHIVLHWEWIKSYFKSLSGTPQ